MNHALVVGGTGMLRGVSLELAKRGFTVSVVARNKDRLQKLVEDAERYKGRIHPISLDYHNISLLKKSIEDAIRNFDPIELAVVWVHDSAPEVPYELARLVDGGENRRRYYHILGSSTADPSRAAETKYEGIKNMKNINYVQIILGFVIESHSSRWLRNEEISQGVIQALQRTESPVIVGSIEPWSAKP